MGRRRKPPNAWCVDCRRPFYAGKRMDLIRCDTCRKGKQNISAGHVLDRWECPLCGYGKSFKATICRACFVEIMDDLWRDIDAKIRRQWVAQRKIQSHRRHHRLRPLSAEQATKTRLVALRRESR
ncbi:hypothetical protein ACFLSJ_07180 [Verrucomicrobiota bacterium]